MATALETKYGEKPIQVVEFEKRTKDSGEKVLVPIIHIDRITQIIKDSNAENITVVIISVAGVARSGKSFLLNLMINRNIWQVEQSSENFWLSETDWITSGRTVTGFNWAQSDKAVTHGMWMWERAIITKLNDGSKVAFLYMDTQGTGDRIESGHPSMDPLIMFLSLEISAIQIHNINQFWRKEDTEVYEVCKLYGEKVDMKGQNGRPFNSLVLVYRNWQNDDRLGYIENYLEEEIRENAKDDEYRATLNGINESFNSVCAVMLPYPGKAVTKAKGELSLGEIEEDFLINLETFLKQIYGPHGGLQRNMAVCKKGHQVIKLLEELQLRVGRTDSPAINEPIDHLAETVNSKAYTDAIALYREEIDKTDSCVESIKDLENLSQEFSKYKEKAKINFNLKAFYHGGHKILQFYKQKLEDYMEETMTLRLSYHKMRLAAEDVRKREGRNEDYMALMEECRSLKEKMEKMQSNRGWGIRDIVSALGLAVTTYLTAGSSPLIAAAATAGRAAIEFMATSSTKKF